MTSPVKTYLAELHKIHAMGAGTGEVSLYNPLQNLLNEIGRGNPMRRNEARHP